MSKKFISTQAEEVSSDDSDSTETDSDDDSSCVTIGGGKPNECADLRREIDILKDAVAFLTHENELARARISVLEEAMKRKRKD